MKARSRKIVLIKTIKARRQSKVFAGMTQESAGQKRWQRQQHTAFGDIKRSFKTRRNLIKFSEARRQPFDGRGRPSSHRGGTIRFSALAFGARDYRRCGRLFFLAGMRTRPARMAF